MPIPRPVLCHRSSNLAGTYHMHITKSRRQPRIVMKTLGFNDARNGQQINLYFSKGKSKKAQLIQNLTRAFTLTNTLMLIFGIIVLFEKHIQLQVRRYVSLHLINAWHLLTTIIFYRWLPLFYTQQSEPFYILPWEHCTRACKSYRLLSLSSLVAVRRDERENSSDRCAIFT